ncbi:hypothetical protein J5N97_009520 [Dioscorea zingiberensis]|uniref:Uncharacterized protein n=1 Tax=Dioscorea zingiberensis TaxID=325984 RepID=A0A9D5CZM7_9LILI|nr:hypothetical protein J5N97_009520 [Dioscorea zingiberensis]
MNRKKQRRTSTSSGDDELAVVKAAAWAWYQRGSGNQGKPFRESEAAAFPARFACRPSRFKLEMESELLQRSDPEPGGSEKSLLDVYEVERITRQIERFVIATADERDRIKKRDKGTIRTTKGMVKRVNGFWLRHAIGICGTREAVVEAHVLSRPARARK